MSSTLLKQTADLYRLLYRILTCLNSLHQTYFNISYDINYGCPVERGVCVGVEPPEKDDVITVSMSKCFLLFLSMIRYCLCSTIDLSPVGKSSPLRKSCD